MEMCYLRRTYDTITREALWEHLHCIRMPSSLLNNIKDLFAEDAYILMVDLSVLVPCPHEESNRAVLYPVCYFHFIMLYK